MKNDPKNIRQDDYDKKVKELQDTKLEKEKLRLRIEHNSKMYKVGILNGEAHTQKENLIKQLRNDIELKKDKIKELK